MHTILVVDDSRGIREFCRRELEKDGYRVLTVTDGAQAVRSCRKETPDLVVLDVQMPGLDGPATALLLAREGFGMPVIFFTAGGAQGCDELRRALDAPCVEKSEDLAALRAAIEEALERKASHHFGKRVPRGFAGRAP